MLFMIRLLVSMSTCLVLVCPDLMAATVPAAVLPAIEHQALSPAENWIRELADERFQTREAATRHLWELGKPALPLLAEAANSSDPERAFRAAMIQDRILMGVSPQTEPEILAWIDQFPTAPVQRKQALLAKLRGKQAWKPMFKLFAAETNPEVMEKLLPAIHGVPVRAAREALIAGQLELARELLELAPNQWENLIALAEFHRTQGSLPRQIEQAGSLQGPSAAKWRVALALAADDLDGVSTGAEAAGLPRIGALAAAFRGDPLPWFRIARLDEDSTAVSEIYHSAAAKRWKSPADPADEVLRPLLRMAERPGSNDPDEVVAPAFLIGRNAAAEQALMRKSPLLAFKYLEMLERVPEAWKSLGLDANEPLRPDWVAKKIQQAANPDAADQHEVNPGANELLAVVGFLERRGRHDEAWNACHAPLLELAVAKENAFIDLLDQFFGGRSALDGAPKLALRIAADWAGSDVKRWNEVAVAALGDDDDSRFWWRLAGEIAPDDPPKIRLESLLALFQIGADPDHIRTKWIGRVMDHFGKAAEGERIAGWIRLRTLLSATGDNQTLMELEKRLQSDATPQLPWNVGMVQLSAAGRWNEVAELLLGVIASGSNPGIFSRPDLHAYAAAALRRAGREQEAVKHDGWAGQLCLGDSATAQRIGYAYLFGLDLPRAAAWWRRAILFSNTESYDFAAPLESNPLRSYCDFLLENQSWPELAALTEVQASCAILGNASDNPLDLTRLRLIADMARAMALPPERRGEALGILDRCHRDHIKDGTLADFFFPTVRKTFPKEHDAWFEQTWQAMQEMIRQYPDSDNTLNTAAWFASRACRRLQDARGLLDRSLALRPLQAAYLDTYAEIEFAAGDRSKALAWSAQAVNQRPNDVQLRRQQFRFQHEPLPR